MAQTFLLILLLTTAIVGLSSGHTRDPDHIISHSPYEYYVSWSLQPRSYDSDNKGSDVMAKANEPKDEQLKEAAGKSGLCDEGLKRSLLGPEFDEPCDSSAEDLIDLEPIDKNLNSPIFENNVELICREKQPGEELPLVTRAAVSGFFSGESNVHLSISRSLFPKDNNSTTV